MLLPLANGIARGLMYYLSLSSEILAEPHPKHVVDGTYPHFCLRWIIDPYVYCLFNCSHLVQVQIIY